MHGVSRGIRLEVTSQEPGRYRGTATIRQTDFGITPYSGFFGALKLRDEVTVEFEVSIERLRNGSG
jgi:polyisoprenoid-binding protein YceI